MTLSKIDNNLPITLGRIWKTMADRTVPEEEEKTTLTLPPFCLGLETIRMSDEIMNNK